MLPTAMNEIIIRTHGLTIGYFRKKEPFPVQTDLNLEVFRGELTGLIGPNGCGKSTLLRSLSGLQPVLGGKIIVDTLPLERLTLKEKARLLALVLTDKVEVSNLTVGELVALGRNPYTDWLGNLSQNDRQRVAEAIGQVHLEGYEHRFLSELSDGERQRAMIAKALVQDTPVIFLDEPTAHLDLPNRVEVMILLRRLARETNKAVLLSTHELDLALQASDKLWLMAPRSGIVVGTPEDLVLTNSIQTVFANRSFRFDGSTGNFVMNHAGTPRSVSLEAKGEGIRLYWTERALVRCGYRIAAGAGCRVTVDEVRGVWEVAAPAATVTVASLEELLRVVGGAERSLHGNDKLI